MKLYVIPLKILTIYIIYLYDICISQEKRLEKHPSKILTPLFCCDWVEHIFAFPKEHPLSFLDSS